MQRGSLYANWLQAVAGQFIGYTEYKSGIQTTHLMLGMKVYEHIFLVVEYFYIIFVLYVIFIACSVVL